MTDIEAMERLLAAGLAERPETPRWPDGCCINCGHALHGLRFCDVIAGSSGGPSPDPVYCECAPDGTMHAELLRLAPALVAEVHRLRQQAALLGPLVESALKPDGSHRILDGGYCPDCQGQCLRSFTVETPDVSFVAPSPFSGVDGP